VPAGGTSDKIMTSLTIPIHSFVDLITNSSTEIYIEADKGTIEAVKALVNNLLKVAKSDLTADDLFTITLLTKNDDYEFVENPEKVSESDEGYREAKISVVAKDSDSVEAQAAAKVLSDLTGLFDINASYNG
jgi:hypothetical protein